MTCGMSVSMAWRVSVVVVRLGCMLLLVSCMCSCWTWWRYDGSLVYRDGVVRSVVARPTSPV